MKTMLVFMKGMACGCALCLAVFLMILMISRG